MRKTILKFAICLAAALFALSACSPADKGGESGADPSDESDESLESLDSAEILYDYVLGLKSFEASEGVYTADGAVIECEDETLKTRAQALFEKEGRAVTLTVDKDFAPEGVPDAVLDQAYRVEVGDGVRVTARTERGLYYGALTVSRYVKLQGGLSCGTYIDWPDVAERCLHLDVARKYFSKDWIIEMIRSAAAFGINAVELHFSENEGFRIQCDTDPAIVSDQYLTKDEVREIISAAKEVYVEIIPSFDSPGHLMQILSAHPEYTLTDVDGYNSPKTLDITNKEAVDYLKSLLDEYAELFKDCEKFAIGGDESFGWSDVKRMQFSAWQVLEDYAKSVYGENANAHDAFVGYINDIAAHMTAKGFKVRAWNDGLFRTENQAQVNVPSKDIDVLYWTNNSTLRATDVNEYLDKGYSVINVNEGYMYYVLKDDYKQPSAKEIFNNWHSGIFTGAGSNVSYNRFDTPYEPGEALKGAYFCIWCDKQETQSAEQVMKGSKLALRAMAVKAWNYKPQIDYYTFTDQQSLLFSN